MAKAFKRKGDRFVARLDSLEREVVAGLLEQTRDFLAPAPRAETGDPFDDLVASMGMPSFQEATDPRLEGPRDPALERLLPPAHREDEAVAAEFRRLTEQGPAGAQDRQPRRRRSTPCATPTATRSCSSAARRPRRWWSR